MVRNLLINNLQYTLDYEYNLYNDDQIKDYLFKFAEEDLKGLSI